MTPAFLTMYTVIWQRNPWIQTLSLLRSFKSMILWSNVTLKDITYRSFSVERLVTYTNISNVQHQFTQPCSPFTAHILEWAMNWVYNYMDRNWCSWPSRGIKMGSSITNQLLPVLHHTARQTEGRFKSVFTCIFRSLWSNNTIIPVSISFMAAFFFSKLVGTESFSCSWCFSNGQLNNWQSATIRSVWSLIAWSLTTVWSPKENLALHCLGVC